MNNKISVKLVLFFIALCFFVLNNKSISSSNDNETIMTIGKENVSFGEVRRVYNKSSMRDGSIKFENLSRDSAKSFLNTYSKYKMKVAAGTKEGYANNPAVIEEINRNKKVLAKTYLVDAEVAEPEIQRYIELRKTQKQIAIILADFGIASDTLEAYNKIMSALSEINNGETFENAARKFSADSTSAKNGGVVPVWVTGFRLQRDLESTIYSLKVGEMTKQPLKTNYGYFLIKLLKEEPRTFISISHILIPFKNENVDLGPIVTDTADARRLADSIYQELSKGGNFNSFVKKFSSDKTTANKDGHIGIYARSTGIVGIGENLGPDLENAAFALKDKQIAKPVEAKLGIHILKRDSSVVYPPDFEYDEIKANYTRIFLKNDEEKYYDSLAKVYNFKINDAVFDRVLSSTDTTKMILDTNFSRSLPLDLFSQTLFSISDKSYTVREFIDSIAVNPNNKIVTANRQGLTEIIKGIVQSAIVENATKNMDKTNNMLNILIDEFAQGLVLFQAEQVNIWDKVKFDSVRARKFYDTTKMDIKVALQYDLSEIYIMSKKKAEEVFEDIKSGKISFDSAVVLHSQRQGAREKKGHYGAVNTSNFLAYQAEKNKYKAGDISEPLSFEQGFSIIRINAIIPERKMTFEEALPHISAAVQEELWKSLKRDWEEELSKQYPVKFNDKLINKVFKK